jgi:hypothetical protein
LWWSRRRERLMERTNRHFLDMVKPSSFEGISLINEFTRVFDSIVSQGSVGRFESTRAKKLWTRIVFVSRIMPESVFLP